MWSLSNTRYPFPTSKTFPFSKILVRLNRISCIFYTFSLFYKYGNPGKLAKKNTSFL